MPTGVTEYCPAAQFVHVTFAVVEKALRLVPAGHTESGVHEVALADDQLTPKVQLPQTALAVAVQVEARYLPAAQLLEAHALQGS